MIRDDAVNLLADRLGNRGDTFDTQIINEMQAAQVRLEMLPQVPWFLLFHDTTLATVADAKTVTLPTKFLMEDEYSQLFIVDDSGNHFRVAKKSYDNLRGSMHFDSNSLPEFFALQKNTMYLFPTPSGVNSFDWFYYQKDSTLDTNIENEWLTYAPEIIMAAAGLKIARFMRSAELIQIFQQDYADALTELMLQDEARRQAALESYMGG